MSQTICGVDCSACSYESVCKGCTATKGCPFGKPCPAARYIQIGGKEAYDSYRQKLVDEVNDLHIPGMQTLCELHPLVGGFVNLEYLMPNGKKTKLLDDSAIYLGNQVECAFDIDGRRCFGVVVGSDFILISEYGENGSDPELILYKKRIEA